ncbi:unnamed protein product [Protopolystoma xenopodis]|uniref:Uncharacterized protein n=1 Tax=Protopolystoma xenopodis TaxID=117903 RepID=A0A448X6U8_9PLAT|nr:unnamed protein product [Protopolystoma xenopodis]
MTWSVYSCLQPTNPLRPVNTSAIPADLAPPPGPKKNEPSNLKSGKTKREANCSNLNQRSLSTCKKVQQERSLALG